MHILFKRMRVLFKECMFFSKERAFFQKNAHSFLTLKKNATFFFAFFFRVKKELKCSFLRPNLTQKECCVPKKNVAFFFVFFSNFWRLMKPKSSSNPGCTLRSLTQLCDAHCGAWLSGDMHTAELFKNSNISAK